MNKVLSNLKRGQSGIIAEIKIDDMNKKIHLLEMGLTKGTKIKVKKKAPMGGTISIELRGYELCISEKEAEKIFLNWGRSFLIGDGPQSKRTVPNGKRRRIVKICLARKPK